MQAAIGKCLNFGYGSTFQWFSADSQRGLAALDGQLAARLAVEETGPEGESVE